MMPIHNLTKYTDNSSKTSANLWQCRKDEADGDITDSESFKFKAKLTKKPSATGNT